MRRVAAAVLAMWLLAMWLTTGCSGSDSRQARAGSPATPAAAPVPTGQPAGTVLPAGVDATSVAVLAGGRQVAVGTRDAVLVLDTAVDAVPRGEPASPPAPAQPAGSARIAVADPVRAIAALPGGGFRAIAGDQLVSEVAGTRSIRRLPGVAAGLAVIDDATTAVALPDNGTIAVLDASGAVVRSIATGGRPTAVAAIPGVDGGPARIGVVDAGQSSLTVYRLDTGAREQALRAGDGATNVVGDETGRFFVVDTRDGEVLAFSTGPLVLRQRYPVAGAPFGLAYQRVNRRIWVSLTARNEVVELDVTGGTPREVARHPTPRQADAVAVDPAGTAVAVAGRADGVVQLIGA